MSWLTKWMWWRKLDEISDTVGQLAAEQVVLMQMIRDLSTAFTQYTDIQLRHTHTLAPHTHEIIATPAPVHLQPHIDSPPAQLRANIPPLPRIVECPQCTRRYDLRALMGDMWGRSDTVTIVCDEPQCSAHFDITGAGVSQRCSTCGHSWDACKCRPAMVSEPEDVGVSGG